MNREMLYLDNNATTRVADEVLAAMTPYYTELFGNAHSAHALGHGAHAGVEAARAEIATLLDCETDEVIFTSCGTEGNAMIIRGLVDPRPARRTIVTTSVEHPSVMLLLRALEKSGDIALRVVPVDSDGALDLDAMRNAIDGSTLLVSVMLAQNETGVIHPVRDVADFAHAEGALLHVDAVQAIGKMPVSMRETGADFLTISGHKFHAPKGVGALTRRRGVALQPLWYGGGQELGMRSGTEPVPSIAGLGMAARMAREHLPRVEETRTLRDRFESSIRERIGEVTVNGATQPRLVNTANISFHDLPADEVVRKLDGVGICVSAGAACNSGKVEPSATMRAMGKPLRVAMGAVRFSLSRYTTASEIEQAVELVCDTVAAARI